MDALVAAEPGHLALGVQVGGLLDLGDGIVQCNRALYHLGELPIAEAAHRRQTRRIPARQEVADLLDKPAGYPRIDAPVDARVERLALELQAHKDTLHG